MRAITVNVINATARGFKYSVRYAYDSIDTVKAYDVNDIYAVNRDNGDNSTWNLTVKATGITIARWNRRKDAVNAAHILTDIVGKDIYNIVSLRYNADNDEWTRIVNDWNGYKFVIKAIRNLTGQLLNLPDYI